MESDDRAVKKLEKMQGKLRDLSTAYLSVNSYQTVLTLEETISAIHTAHRELLEYDRLCRALYKLGFYIEDKNPSEQFGLVYPTALRIKSINQALAVEIPPDGDKEIRTIGSAVFRGRYV